jgi:hypothetical protein
MKAFASGDGEPCRTHGSQAMKRITIYDVPKEGEKCLGRSVWVFAYFDDRGLILDCYADEERPTTRHKFKVTRAYHRLSHNRDRMIEVIPEEKAPLPDWVKDAALEQFIANVKVGKWGR